MEDTVGDLGPHLQVKTIRMWELLRNTGALKTPTQDLFT
jgi:hypothetical protein